MEGCDHRTLAQQRSRPHWLHRPTRREAGTVTTLNPAMSQQEMDTFLSSLGAGHNPFSVQQIYDGRKCAVFRRSAYVR